MSWTGQQAGPVVEDPGAQDFYNGCSEDNERLNGNFGKTQSLGASFRDRQSLTADYQNSQNPYAGFQEDQSVYTSFQNGQNLSANFRGSQNPYASLEDSQSLRANSQDNQVPSGNVDESQGLNPLIRSETMDLASFAARTGIAPVGLSDDMESPQGVSSSALPSSKPNSASSELKQSAFSEAPRAEAPNRFQPVEGLSRGSDFRNSHENTHLHSAISDTEHDMHEPAHATAAHRVRWELLRSLVRQHDDPAKDHHQPEQPVYSSNTSPPKVRQHQFQPGPPPARTSSTTMRPLMLPQMVEDRKALRPNTSGHAVSNTHPQDSTEKTPPLPPRAQVRPSESSIHAMSPGHNPLGTSISPPMPPRPTTPAMQPSRAASQDLTPPSKPLQRSNALANKPPSRPGSGTNFTPPPSYMPIQQTPHNPPPHNAQVHLAVPGADSAHQELQQNKMASTQVPVTHNPLSNPKQHSSSPIPALHGLQGTNADNLLTTHPATHPAQAIPRPPPREAQARPVSSAAVHAAQISNQQTPQLSQKNKGAPPSTTPAQARKPNAPAATPPRPAAQPRHSTPSRSVAPPDRFKTATPPPHPAAVAHPVAHTTSSATHTLPHGPTSHPSPIAQPHATNAQAPAHSPPPAASKAAPSSHPPAASRLQTSAKPAGPHPSPAPSRSPAPPHPQAATKSIVPHPLAPHPPAAPHPANPQSVGAIHPSPPNPASVTHPPTAPHPAATHPVAPHTAPRPAAPHPAASHPAASHSTASHPLAPHPPAKPHSVAVSHPQTPSKPVEKPSTPGDSPAPPHQAPRAHATKIAPTGQPKPHPAAQSHSALPSPAQHPSAAQRLNTQPPPASHSPQTQPAHTQQHHTQPHGDPAPSHQSTPPPHAQPAKSALGPHPTKGTPTKTALAHPTTQPHPSSHPNPPNHPNPAVKSVAPKSTHPANSKTIPNPPSHPQTAAHPLSHPTPTAHPSHLQHPPAKPSPTKSPHGTPSHPPATAHAAPVATKHIVPKSGSHGQAGAVKSQNLPSSAHSTPTTHALKPSSQRTTPPHGSKRSSQTPTQSSKQPFGQCQHAAGNHEHRPHHPARKPKPDFDLSDSLPAILGQLAGSDDPDGEVDLEQEADNIVHLFLYGTALVFKSFISEIKEEEGWGRIDCLGEGYEGEQEGDGGHDETLSESRMSSRSEFSGLDHESEGNELD